MFKYTRHSGMLRPYQAIGGSLVSGEIEQFVSDPFTPELRTHPLTGKLHGLHVFRVDADCRVVFRFTKGYSKVLLIDIGTHGEVY